MLAREERSDVIEQLEWKAVDLPAPVAGVVGTSVGQYDILEEIGRGGMGVVYLARQRGLDRHVALKALHVSTGLGVNAGEALVKESRIAGSLSHPNIVTVYEFLEEGETPYIAMEYVQRGSLRPWMGCMSMAQFTGVFEGLLAGLAAVEPSGIVHRDLKPENVMVTADGRVKIADFGIAKATQRAGGLTMASTPTGITVGTPAYMAPEQALCESVGPATDLYSVGIMAYEHLVGHVPFRNAGTPMAILLAHINDSVPPACDAEPRVDRTLSEWVGRLLIKDPTKRTQNAATAWDQLEEIAIDRLGPMWRREARLTEMARTRISPRRRDPIEFNSQAVTMGQAPLIDTAFAAGNRTQSLASRTRRRPTQLVSERARGTSTVAGRRAMLALAAGALAAAAGFGAARSGTSAGQHRIRVSVGGLSVSLPSGWTRSSASADIPGYEFKSPMILQWAGGSRLTIGVTTAPTAALLPPTLIAGGSSTPLRENVVLGGKPFFRYRDIKLSGSAATAALYTQPTSVGVLVGVCRMPAAPSARASLGCEQILSSITLSTGEALPLAQSEHYAAVSARTLATYKKQTDSATRMLTRASTATAQAKASRSLQGITKHAAVALRAAGPGPSETPGNDLLAGALDAVAAGYGTMERGARAERPKEWQAGATAVRAGSRALEHNLTQLRAAG